MKIVPSADKLITRGFSAEQIRESKGAWNSLYLTSSNVTYLNSNFSDLPRTCSWGVKLLILRERSLDLKRERQHHRKEWSTAAAASSSFKGRVKGSSTSKD